MNEKSVAINHFSVGSPLRGHLRDWKVFFISARMRRIAQISSFTLAYFTGMFSSSSQFLLNSIFSFFRFMTFVISFVRRSTFMGFLFMFIFSLSLGSLPLLAALGFLQAAKVEEEAWLKAKRFFARIREAECSRPNGVKPPTFRSCRGSFPENYRVFAM